MREASPGAFCLKPIVFIEVRSGEIRALVCGRESQIGYGKAHLKEHLFVEGLHLEHGVKVPALLVFRTDGEAGAVYRFQAQAP